MATNKRDEEEIPTLGDLKRIVSETVQETVSKTVKDTLTESQSAAEKRRQEEDARRAAESWATRTHETVINAIKADDQFKDDADEQQLIRGKVHAEVTARAADFKGLDEQQTLAKLEEITREQVKARAAKLGKSGKLDDLEAQADATAAAGDAPGEGAGTGGTRSTGSRGHERRTDEGARESNVSTFDQPQFGPGSDWSQLEKEGVQGLRRRTMEEGKKLLAKSGK